MLAHYGVEVVSRPFLPAPLLPLALPAWLVAFLEATPLTPSVTKSEQTVSEVIIYPVFRALRTHLGGQLGIFSGAPLSAAGLTGVCAFILTTAPDLYPARPPILVVAGAKRQGSLKAVPQGVAEMMAAQRINHDAGLIYPAVYGCITTGDRWQFLQPTGQQAPTDPQLFYLHDLQAISGAFHWIVTQFK